MDQTQTTLASKLKSFFQQWPKHLTFSDTQASPVLFPATSALQQFFNTVAQPLQALRHDAFRFDPWKDAGIGHNEVRNSTLLAWLLNPFGSHGFGNAPLYALLKLIRAQSGDHFPEQFDRYCHIEVEKNPTGDTHNRVDIEIDTDAFFLFIEVKIRAGEQENQMLRYCDEAAARAGIRPWAVAFLTVDGEPSETIGPDISPEHLPALSWRQLAMAFDDAIAQKYREITASSPVSTARLMAACSAICFIDHMRKL